ncbi:MAG TPA: lamin tail domain-containing protein, partial [Acidimicrobiia bacterium]|nr:lamin tail domain-containing protein [Acidimicrobiia bacterium]
MIRTRPRRGRAVRWLVGGLLAVAPVAGLLPPRAGAVTASVAITEVTPWGSGNAPYAADWFELTNTGASAVDITGWRMDDNSSSFAASVPLTGVTTIAAGQSVVFIEGSAATATSFANTWFGGSVPSGFAIGTYSGSGVGLSTGGDAVNVYDSTGTLVTNVTFGASDSTPPLQSFDNAAGASGTISTLSTAGVNGAFVAANDANEIGSPGTITTDPDATTTTSAPTTTTTTTPATTFQAWPGSSTVQAASNYLFNGNLSGLDDEGTGPAPGVLWGVRNGPGTLFRLLFDGTNWNPDPNDGWSNGKALHYPDGTGDPDSEGVTFVGDSSARGIYVSTERNNNVSNVSRISVLRFDPSAAGTSLTATNEWNLTPDLPPQGANLGAEAITWVDDSYLVSQNFYDETKGHTYNPAEYPNHGSGLF